MSTAFLTGFCIGIISCIMMYFIKHTDDYDAVINRVIIDPPVLIEETTEVPVNHSPKPKLETSQDNIDLVVSGLTRIGVKKAKAKSIVNKMCKDKYYDDAQDLFEACFPHINS